MVPKAPAMRDIATELGQASLWVLWITTSSKVFHHRHRREGGHHCTEGCQGLDPILIGGEHDIEA